MDLTIRDRVKGGLLGLLVGDALGVPYEFHSPKDIPEYWKIDMTPPVGFGRAHVGVPPGTWSDDGAQALALLDSLLVTGEVDVWDMSHRFLSWYQNGAYTPDGRVFDVGVQTSMALRRISEGVQIQDAARKDEQANGNGSLMRVLPLALWHTGSDVDLVADAHLQSMITHGHVRSQVCCALYCLWARRELAGAVFSWTEAVNILRGIYGEEGVFRSELEEHVKPDTFPVGKGTGYVVDCLWSARMAVESNHSYRTAVMDAVSLGHDTDTTACVAGGIAGIRYGYQGIPRNWLNMMDLRIPNRLLERMGV